MPRWEWRTVGDLEDADEALAFLQEAEPAESDETYVLSMHGDASVKIRDGLLDVKVLRQVNGAGLQLWVPTMKAPFPLDDGRGRHGRRRPGCTAGDEPALRVHPGGAGAGPGRLA